MFRRVNSTGGSWLLRSALLALAALAAGGLSAGAAVAGEGAAARAPDLPANAWKLVCEGGGKTFSNLVSAESVGRLYAWGPGGFELVSFSPADGKWVEALPEAKKEAWAGGKAPAFRMYGQGAGWDKVPHYMAVGGSEFVSTVRFWDTEGVERPSPVYPFNQACHDSKRGRIFFFAGGKTFALDPKANTWTDLKPEKGPAACEALVWASCCHDPVNDEVLLFGGGMALNPEGGARTWLYDCAGNSWRRPELKAEPPLRCNAPIVYDRKSEAMIMFGGDNQAAALNDTWVYRCRERRWEEKKPSPSPPPMFAPAAAAVPGGGHVLVCGPNAAASRAAGAETWAYAVAADSWRPVGEGAGIRGTWLAAAGSEAAGAVFLAACGQKSATYALRYDPAGPAGAAKGAPPGAVAWKHAAQKQGLESAPPPDTAAQEKFLKELPANQWVEAKPPATVINKTWGSATFDTDRGEVVYTGGGHSGYSGNDVAHYSVAGNRWSLAFPPCFPPFLESTNSTVFGWAYDCRPWSQHTYRWYAYDPVSKSVVYCPRNNLRGKEMILPDAPGEVVRHTPQMGLMTFAYDCAQRKFGPPSFGRPFANTWDLALAGTPRGVYAATAGKLFLAEVKEGKVAWKPVDAKVPGLKPGYNYEWMPLVYDSRRDRLLLFMGTDKVVEAHERPLKEGGAWTQLAPQGSPAIAREAAYSPKHDAVIMLAPKGRLFVLDCAANQWKEPDIPLNHHRDVGVDTAMVYDPARDLCILLQEQNFAAPNQVFLLRYDPATAKYRGAAPAAGR